MRVLIADPDPVVVVGLERVLMRDFDQSHEAAAGVPDVRLADVILRGATVAAAGRVP